MLGLPAEFVPSIRHALEFGIRRKLEIHLPYQSGWLHGSDSTGRRVTQPLSDWHLSIGETAGAGKVRLSAALCATLPLEDWLVDTRNLWGENAPRLEATFTVDGATRIAC